MTPFADHPTKDDPCSKCGARKGSWLIVYHRDAHQDTNYASWPTTTSPHLCWVCKRCGYNIETETADALVEAAV